MTLVRVIAARYPQAWAVLPGLIMVGLGVTGFGALVDALVERDDIWEADSPLLEFFVDSREPWLTSVMTGITSVFGPVLASGLVAVVAVVWWRLSHSWKDPLLLVGAMVFSTALSFGLKVIIGRPRPESSAMSIPGQETTFSFPSGHTTAAATFVLVGGYLLWRRHREVLRLWMWIGASAVVIGLVAISRLYLGYHFLTDVLAGFCLGLVTLGVASCVARWRDIQTTPLHLTTAPNEADSRE